MSDATVIYRCVPSGLVAPVLTALDLAGSGARIPFTIQTNRRYDVDWRSSLTGGTWNLLTNDVAGTGGVVTVSDPGALSLPMRFYRVRVKTP